MKKIVVALLAACILGTVVAAVPVSAKSGGNSIKVKIVESGSLKAAGKASKANFKSKKKKTKSRVKKLQQLGIGSPKNYWDYGKDLTLQEMGQIIAAWIVDVWTRTGQLPAALTNDQPDWLMVNVNGSCISGTKTCDRWK